MADVTSTILLQTIIRGCIESGQVLYETCQAAKHAGPRYREYRVRVEKCWAQIETQLSESERLVPNMSERHQIAHQEIIEIVQSKLQSANMKLSRLVQYSRGESGYYSTKEKLIAMKQRANFGANENDLNEAVLSLEKWQQIFDPTWFLTIAIAGPAIDHRLMATTNHSQTSTSSGNPAGPITLAKQFLKARRSDDGEPLEELSRRGLRPGSVRKIPLSVVSIAERAGKKETFILDPITTASRPSAEMALRDTRDFARLLRHTDPQTSGLLKCKARLKIVNEGSSPDATITATTKDESLSLSFVFRVPSCFSDVQSLRWRLLHPPQVEYGSLSERFELANQLVRAVSYVHAYGFVHKNIRPESILLLGNDSHTADMSTADTGTETPRPPETAVLVGFEELRNAGGRTRHSGDEDWEKNLYRHPLRQTKHPQAKYEMRHDIYSIGVCLLEIGLWESFVVYDEKNSKPRESDFLLEALTRYCSSVDFESKMDDDDDEKGETRAGGDPEVIKGFLIELARGMLRQKMGTRFSEVVETCLTCLDADNEDFDDDGVESSEGVAVGIQYIQKVVVRLGHITV